MTHHLPLSEELWVKPLEWSADGQGSWCNTIMGQYRVYAAMWSPQYYWRRDHKPSLDKIVLFDEEEQAKAAAQTDFNTRILSALSDLALTALRANSGEGWQPIETAPKDGTRVLLLQSDDGDEYERSVGVGYWGDASDRYVQPPDWAWLDSFDDKKLLEATHWRPLPAPPIRSQHQKADQ